MADSAVIGLFLEDIAHEEFITSLIERIASEEGVSVKFEVRNATGGVPRMRRELSIFLKSHSRIDSPAFDILIITQDTDCKGSGDTQRSVLQIVERSGYSKPTVVATPDPHIEIWYLADTESLQAMRNIERKPRVLEGDCTKDKYKMDLAHIFSAAPFGGIEYAREIVREMDLYNAGRNSRSLRNFIDELKSKIVQIRNVGP